MIYFFYLVWTSGGDGRSGIGGRAVREKRRDREQKRRAGRVCSRQAESGPPGRCGAGAHWRATGSFGLASARRGRVERNATASKQGRILNPTHSTDPEPEPLKRNATACTKTGVNCQEPQSLTAVPSPPFPGADFPLRTLCPPGILPPPV